MSTKRTPAVPIRTPMYDASGNMTRPWILFFEHADTKDESAAIPSPTVLGAADFTIELAPAGDNSPYGAKQVTGEPIVKIRLTVNVNPADVTTWGVWGCEDIADPTPEDFRDLGVNFTKAATGSTVGDFWLDRKIAGSTWKFICLPSTANYVGAPSADCAIKSVVVDPVDAPAQVTGFSVTLDPASDAYRGRLVFGFTKPADPEYWCCNVYRMKFTDGTFATPADGKDASNEDDWSIVSSSIGPIAQQEFWNKPASTEYWSFRAESVSRAGVANKVSRPVSNLTVPAGSVPGGLPDPPARLGPSDFSIALAPVGDNSPFGTDSMGKPLAKFRITVTADPADVKTWGVWGCEDISVPAVTDFRDLGVNFTLTPGGVTWDFWLDRKIAGSTWKFVVIPSNEYYLGAPTVADVIKTVTVAAVGAPGQVTSFTATLVQSPGGAHWKFAWTNPTDAEYWTNNIDAVQCDSSFNPLSGHSYGERHFSSINSFEQDSDFPYPAQTEYWKFRSQTISRAGITNTTGSPTANVTVPSAYSDGGNLFGTNGGFEYGLKGYITYGASPAIDTGVYYSGGKALRVTGGEQGVWQEISPVKTGDQFILESYMHASSGATGVANVSIQFFDTYGVQIGSTLHKDVDVTTLPPSWWGLVSTGVFTAPANTAKIRAWPVYTMPGLSGSVYVDNALLQRVNASAILPTGSDVVWDDTNHKAIIGAAKVLLGMVKPGEFDTTVFKALGISDSTKLADGLMARSGLFGTAVILNAHIGDGQITDAKMGSCSVNKLLAGTATFLGDVTFTRGTSSIVISSSRITLKANGLDMLLIDSTDGVSGSSASFGTLTASGSLVLTPGSHFCPAYFNNSGGGPTGSASFRLPVYTAGGVSVGWIPIYP